MQTSFFCLIIIGSKNGANNTVTIVSNSIGGLVAVVVIILVIIGVLIYCKKKKRRLNTPAYVYNNEVETLDNPAYVSSLKLAEKSGGCSTLDFNFECSQHFTAEENIYATID